MALFTLIPKYVDKFPPLLKVLGKMLHPLALDLYKFACPQVHDPYRNIDTLVAIQDRVWMFGDIEEDVNAHYCQKGKKY